MASKNAKMGGGMLDLAFAMDCTGSMGSYIQEAKDNIEKIVNDVVESEKCDVRLALIEYRDHPPEDSSFVTKKHDFTHSAATMKSWLEECNAEGGGDTPEAVADALNDVLQLSWREEATKMCVLITDAPPHGISPGGDSFPEGCPLELDPKEITKQMVSKGVCLYVVGCEPSICDFKDFYLALAHIAGGQYVSLKEAKGIAKVIIYGSVEEISLRKLEAEAVKEILQMKSSCIEINEEVLTSSLHKRWKERGEKTKQLTLNQRGLETAKSSAIAMEMVKSKFSDTRKLLSTSSRGHKDVSKKFKEVGSANPKEGDKIAAVTTALADLKTSSSSIKVDLSGLTDQIDFGPAKSTSSEKSADESGYQCIDGGVTFDQTMRVVQRSLNKMIGNKPTD